MTERALRIGVIGVGGMGERHARNLAGSVARGRVAAVMDLDTARASAVAEKCGGARVYDDAIESARTGRPAEVEAMERPGIDEIED